MAITNKICIGTAQFGLDYGINNKLGKISLSEITRIFDLCNAQGINMLDTAYAYGNSQEVIGNLDERKKFNIISKYSTKLHSDSMEYELKNSLEKLNRECVFGYLFHRSEHLFNRSIYEKALELKKSGFYKKLGVSIYDIETLEKIFDQDIAIDIVQLPYNVLDRKFEPFFPLLREKNIEVHIRSVFLQGIIFKELEELSGYFRSFKDPIRIFSNICEKYGYSKNQGALNFVLWNEYLNKVIIGIDSYDQLKNNIDDIIEIPNPDFLNEIGSIQINDSSILNPVNWK